MIAVTAAGSIRREKTINTMILGDRRFVEANAPTAAPQREAGRFRV
jgi:hypothetical protein